MQAAQIVQALSASHAALSGGDTQTAEHLLKPVLALANAPAKAEYLLGLIRGAQGRVSEAEALMKGALRRAPSDHECWNSLGALYQRGRQWEPAIACFKKAIAVNAQYAPARTNLVKALLSANRTQDAEAEARAWLKQANSALAHTALASVLRAQQRDEAALEELDRALLAQPQQADARHDRAQVLDKLGRGEDAINEYSALYAGGLRTPALCLHWASALLDLGRAQEAERILVDAIAARPRDLPLQDGLARLRWVMGDDQDFTRDFAAAVASAPENVELRVGCADLLRRSGRRSEAADMIRDGLTLFPAHHAFLGALGVLLGEMDQLDEAEATLKRTAPVQRQHWSAAENLVEVLLRNQKPQEALAIVTKARAALPRDQAWVAQHATALAALRDPRHRELYDFDTMVRSYELPPPPGFASALEFNAALAERIRALHTLSTHPIDQSLVNGTQTSKGLLESRDPLVRAFLRSVETAMNEFAASMPEAPDHPFWGRKPRSAKTKLVGCWSVRLRQGGYHVNHIHPEGWISSAYYMVVPAEANGANDHQGWIQFGEPRRPVPGVSAGHFVEPRPGLLVLFPSYMWHGTVPFAKGDERLTIAMDAVPAP